MKSSPVATFGYVVVETSDMDAWRAYAGGLLGMMASKLPLPEGTYAFRMDDRMARVILEPGEDSVAAVGWEVTGRPEWEDLLERLEKAGIPGGEATGDDAQKRGVAELWRGTDPSGDVVEFGYMPMLDVIDRFVSPTGVRFVTGDQGMGHMTKAVANYEETIEFYTQVLGFRQRETIDNKNIRASFSSPSPRHHSIALLDGHGENHFHHVMLEVDTVDDVGRCLDRVLNGEAELTVGLGRHFNDKITSFYMASPSGLQVEYGYGGLYVKDQEWTENTQGGVGGASLWGHHPVEDAHHESVAEGFERVET
jgi:3,4-dihydroxy-9,10-secoandrosta-1,3,5(10)-triene-9,17-dione 4,5-dioxygenase